MRIVLLLLVGLLTSCEEPTVRFDVFELPRPVNLSKVLGTDPLLLGPHDTLALRLQFNTTTGFTSFWLRGDSVEQPWFTARAFRFRGLYYLAEKRPGAGYWVHAVRIGRGQVQGLGTGYQQMRDLSLAAWQDQWPRLLASDGDSMRLRFNRRQLREFYTTETDRFDTYQLAAEPAELSATSAATPAASQPPALYPNPASTTATVHFGEAAAHQVQLYDERGRLLHTYSTAATELPVPVANLPTGTYLLHIGPAGKRPTTTLRLAVAH